MKAECDRIAQVAPRPSDDDFKGLSVADVLGAIGASAGSDMGERRAVARDALNDLLGPCKDLLASAVSYFDAQKPRRALATQPAVAT
eukprot:6299450-Pyramimonas_sp.AAC.1